MKQKKIERITKEEYENHGGEDAYLINKINEIIEFLTPKNKGLYRGKGKKVKI